jgi:hypothetical protein
LFGPKEALAVVAMRTFLGSVFGGGVASFMSCHRSGGHRESPLHH